MIIGNRYNHPNKPSLDAIATPSHDDIIWAAGIYEGEGCCYYYKKIHNVYSGALSTKVDQKNPWLLKRLRDYFGGTVSHRPDNGGFMWRTFGERSRSFLKQIYHYLSPRRQLQIIKLYPWVDGKE